MKLHGYWQRFRVGLWVTYHLERPYRVRWVGVHGFTVTVGHRSWFIGIVQSNGPEIPA